jgi:hypothetical protein
MLDKLIGIKHELNGVKYTIQFMLVSVHI